MVSKNGGLQTGNFGDGGVGFRLGGGEFADLESDTCEKKVGESGFAVKRGLIEKRGSAGAETAGFEVAAFVEEKKALVEIEEPGPDEILLGGEHGAGFCEPLEGLDRFSLLAVSDGFVRERLRGLVTHFELFKAEKTFVGHFAGFFAKVQLEIDLREIHVTQSEMIGITRNFTGSARGK